MKKTKEPARGGRPRALTVGDPKTLRIIRQIASMFGTQSELAATLGVSTRTLLTHFDRDPEARQAWEAGFELGRVSLRRMQFRAAGRGSAALLIFLGKVHLGQREVQEHVVNATVDARTLGDEQILTEATLDELDTLNSAYEGVLDGILARRREARANKVEH